LNYLLIATIVRSHGNGDVDSRNVSTSSQACAEVIEEYPKAADYAVLMQKRSSSFKKLLTQRFSIFISASHVIYGNTNTNTNTNTSVFFNSLLY
jgi:hypothetical protein